MIVQQQPSINGVCLVFDWYYDYKNFLFFLFFVLAEHLQLPEISSAVLKISDNFEWVILYNFERGGRS